MSNHKLTKKDIEKLLADYYPLIRRAARSIPRLTHTDYNTVDDYIQDIQFRVFKHMKNYTPYHRCSAKTYIFNAIRLARGNVLTNICHRENAKGRKDMKISILSQYANHNNFNDSPGELKELDPPCPRPTPKEVIQNKLLGKRLNQYFVCLSPREVDILNCYYGLNGHLQMNLMEIAKSQKVTHQFVNVIRQRALRKVRLLIKEENERERKERRKNHVNSSLLPL
jgi:RNA polymerase sigma factor (sigma-70 family)